MDWLLLLLTSVGVLVLFFLVLAPILAYLVWHFTRIEKGHIVFITRGNTLKVVWPDVGNYRMSTKEDFNGWHWLIRSEDKKERDEAFYFGTLPGTRWLQKLLWELLGIRFVSFLWPNIKVHEFRVSRKRLLESSDVKSGLEPGQSLKARVIDSPRKGEPVNSLLFLAPRPIYLEGVELAGDNSKINLLLLPVFQAVIPSLPVFYLEGDFFPLLDAVIQAALIDFFATHQVAVDGDEKFIESNFDEEKGEKEPDGEGRGGYKRSFLTYDLWRKLKKGRGSPIEKHLRQINATQDYYDELKRAEKDELADQLVELGALSKSKGKKRNRKGVGKKLEEAIGEGIIPRFGFALVSFRLVDWEEHPDTGPLAKALRAKETERHLADGARETAKGEAAAIRIKGEASEESIERRFGAAYRHGGRTGVNALAIETATANLQKVPNLRTIALGQSTITNIPLDDRSDKDESVVKPSQPADTLVRRKD